MKVAWLTPFSAASAIGRYSKYAAEALAKHAEVDLLIFDREKLHQTSLKIVPISLIDFAAQLECYDIIVYNIGDNSNYHSAIFDTLRLHRGITIAHDVCLQNLFCGHYVAVKKAPLEYRSALQTLYGEQIANRIYSASASVEMWAKEDFATYHGSELFLPYCTGLITHSHYHMEKLLPLYSGPKAVIAFPNMNEFQPSTNPGTFSGYDADCFNILTVGNVNPNKCLDATLRAIAGSDVLRKNVCLISIGSLANEIYVQSLERLASELGIKRNLRLLGFVDHQELGEYYRHADAVVNLRYPALEGASASLAEQMLLGKATIVTDAGVYAEVPDNCVIKVRPDHSSEDTMAALEILIDKRALADEIGARAKAYAEQLYSRETYGKKLYEFLCSVEFTKPLESLIGRLTSEMRKMGITSDMHLGATLAEEIETLFYAYEKNATEE